MRHPAAFINVISEGRNFAEALKHLQETWDELYETREALEKILALASGFCIASETHYGMKGSGNYTADREINPTAVWFANGRHVKLVDNHLEVGWGKP